MELFQSIFNFLVLFEQRANVDLQQLCEGGSAWFESTYSQALDGLVFEVGSLNTLDYL